MEAQPCKKQWSGAHAAWSRCQCSSQEGSTAPRRKSLGKGSLWWDVHIPGVPAPALGAGSPQAGLEGEGWLSHCHENRELSTETSVGSFQAAQVGKDLYERLKPGDQQNSADGN